MTDNIIDAAAENRKLLAYNRELYEAMNFLKDHRYFRVFMQYLEDQQNLRMRQLLQMPMNADDIIQRTYVSGELATFEVVRALPETLYATSKQQVDQALAYIEKDKEDEDFDNAEDPDTDD